MMETLLREDYWWRPSCPHLLESLAVDAVVPCRESPPGGAQAPLSQHGGLGSSQALPPLLRHACMDMPRRCPSSVSHCVLFAGVEIFHIVQPALRVQGPASNSRRRPFTAALEGLEYICFVASIFFSIIPTYPLYIPYYIIVVSISTIPI